MWSLCQHAGCCGKAPQRPVHNHSSPSCPLWQCPGAGKEQQLLPSLTDHLVPCQGLYLCGSWITSGEECPVWCQCRPTVPLCCVFPPMQSKEVSVLLGCEQASAPLHGQGAASWPSGVPCDKLCFNPLVPSTIGV